MSKIQEILSKFPDALVTYDARDNCYIRIPYDEETAITIKESITTDYTIKEYHTALNGQRYYTIIVSPQEQ